MSVDAPPGERPRDALSPDRPAWAVATIVGVGVVLLVLWAWLAPEYLTVRGFPLDDAWIHAVYVRAFASGQGLSYNPGIPATGETSPLWAMVLAPTHLLSGDAATRVLLIKLTGFALHLLSRGAGSTPCR